MILGVCYLISHACMTKILFKIRLIIIRFIRSIRKISVPFFF